MQKPITNIFFILAFLLLFPMTAFSAADPLASEKAKSTLNYISGLSSLSANKVVSGQFSGGQHYISSECTDVFNLTGYWPGMIGVNYSPIYGGSESDFTQINNLIINYSNSGGLVHIFMHSRNPVTNKFFNSDGSKDTTNVDFVQLVTNGSALNTAWKKELDRVAVGLSQLRDNNVVVLFRPFHEMNGSWFWWGAKDYTQFKNAWI